MKVLTVLLKSIYLHIDDEHQSFLAIVSIQCKILSFKYEDTL
jgi:hypothetical protein